MNSEPKPRYQSASTGTPRKVSRQASFSAVCQPSMTCTAPCRLLPASRAAASSAPAIIEVTADAP